MFSHVRKAVTKIVTALDIGACIMIALLCAWVTIDVIGRSFFGKPIPGTAELASNSIVAILFLEIALVETRKKNLRSDIFLQKFGHVGQGIIDLLSTLCGLVIFVSGTYFCFKGTLLSWRIKEYDGEGSIHIPTYLFKTIVTVGCVFMVIVLLFNLYDAIMGILGKPVKNEAITEGSDEE